jgi:hypothetical protein
MANYYPNSDRSVPLGRPSKYDWNTWTDGEERYLEEGKDFKSMAESFILLARRTARVRGLHVSASIIVVPENGPTTDAAIAHNLEPGKTYVALKFTREKEGQ